MSDAATRLAVFVDVQNVYYTTRDAFGRQFDYRAFWASLTARAHIVSAIAYATDRGDDGQRRFQSALRHIGFTVKLKPYIQRRDGSAKGDWDVGITIDVLDLAQTADTVVLVSGDGDFDLLLHKLRSAYGVRTEVYGVEGLTAAALIQAADRFHPIDAALLQ